MEVVFDGDEIVKRCFKCNEHVISSLNVVYNKTNTTVTLWNKFQIFVYEDLEFGSASKVLVPEFQIHNLIASTNYIICVDYAGNIHTNSLKFKNAPKKRFKYGFQPRECSTVVCSSYNEDYLICLKYENDAYFLSIHKMNTEFSLEKRVIVTGYEHITSERTMDDFFLKTYPIDEKHLESLGKMFNIEGLNIRKKYSIVITSLDKLNVYCCLFSANMVEDEVNVVKLYTCPAEICSIELIEMDCLIVVIGLKIGTLIFLHLKSIKTPNIVYLNTALHKFSVFQDTILYTDGVTMWKADKILSEDITFNQLFVHDVKDFVKFGDQVICTTFKDLIYTFSLDAERSYIRPESIEEYCSAENLLKGNDKLIENIMIENINTRTLLKLQAVETNYMTALCLSNRQDVMDGVIFQKVMIYENYEAVLAENNNVVLTNEQSEYFDTESYFFLIEITTKREHKMGEILSNAIGDLRIHITLVSRNKIVKTTTIKVTAVIKKITLLIPLKAEFIDTSEMRVLTKIITNMPGVLDPTQKIWSILYRKTVILNSEHFLKLNFNYNTKVSSLKVKESVEKLILYTTINQYGNLFEFHDIDEIPISKQFNMYVRLPARYKEVISNDKKMFISKREEYILEQFSSKEFLTGRCCLLMSIGRETVKIEIDDGFSTPMLKISSSNVKIALHMRNFFSNLIYFVFTDFEPGKEFIGQSLYATLENLDRAIKECVSNTSEQEMMSLIEQFERNLIGCLPI